MISQSAGSRPNPNDFLAGKVEEVLTDLQIKRIPTGFEQLAYGKVPDDIKTKRLNNQIVF